MAVYQLKTFADIVAAAMEEIKIQPGDVVTKNRIKRNVNTVYQNEVVPYASWKWLLKDINVSMEPYTSTGTAAVTNGSTTVTLSSAPQVPKKGQLFSVNGQREVYRIAQHAAGSATVTLEVPFTGVTGSAVNYKVWSDHIVLPTGCRDLSSVTHPQMENPLEEVGPIEFKRYVAANPKLEGQPTICCLNDYVDPAPYQDIAGLPAVESYRSSGLVKTIIFEEEVAAALKEGDRIEISGAAHYSFNGEAIVASVTEGGDGITYTGTVAYTDSGTVGSLTIKKLESETSARTYRALQVYPSLISARTTLAVSYLREVPPLENDADEPLMPIEDRAVLKYGTLAADWVRERNPEEGLRNTSLYQAKLSKMASRVQASNDNPVLVADRTYLAVKRRATRPRRRWETD